MAKIILAFSIITVTIFGSLCCNQRKSEGKALANQYCQSCHQLPDPQLLDKKTWSQYVLPNMGRLLGLRYLGFGSYFDEKDGGIALEDWNKITQYYLKEAPDSLLPGIREKIMIGLKNFEPADLSFGFQNPATTYVGIQPGQSLLFADGFREKLYLINSEGKKDSLVTGRGVVNVHFNQTDFFSLSMGVLHPSDEKAGKLLSQNLSTKKTGLVLDSLQRPVYAEYADLNNDRLEDIIICEFGNTRGQLSWFEQDEKKNYTKHILRPLPGAVRTALTDANGDGRPDILALMAQADEGIFLYTNMGNNQFSEKRLLRFPPSYGSNYFEMLDFNKDGYPDLLVTNGDNGDYPPLMKPYHGIRIYLNDGHYNFKEELFLPMNGVGKAIARDFDGDGDLDIASISYFPDYSHSPEESFVYWENVGENNFQPFSFKGSLAGRWLTMDAGDLDGDGDIDLVLGNTKFTLGSVPEWLKKKWYTYTPSLLVLKNKHK